MSRQRVPKPDSERADARTARPAAVAGEAQRLPGALEQSHPTTQGSRHTALRALQRSNGNQGVQRLLARKAAVPRGLIQARRVSFPATHWGSAPGFTSDSEVWFEPSAEVSVGGTTVATAGFSGLTDTVTLSPGSSGNITIRVQTGWFQDNMIFNYSGSGNATINVPFHVSAAGELQLEEPVQSVISGGDAAELISPVEVTKGTNPTGGYINFQPTIRSEGSVTASSGIGAEAGVGGTFGAEESTARTQSWRQAFRLQLNVPRPEAPTATTYITSASFDVNSALIPDATERHIVDWYYGLPADVKQQIERGTAEVILRGHASTTGSPSRNRELSSQRSEAVRRILADVAGSDARFRAINAGEYQATTADEVEDNTERRVEIEVTPTPPAPGSSP